jgi:cell division protein FtsW
MLRPGQIIALLVVGLLGIGLVMVHSAGMSVGSELAHPHAWLTSRHLLYALLAVAAMAFTSHLNVRQLFITRGLLNPLFLVVGVALALAVLTLVPGVGRTVGGSSRWLYLGPRSWGVSFQPSELVKWALVLALAWWCARRSAVMHRFWHGLIPPLLLIAVMCGLVGFQDLGTGVLLLAVAGCMLLAGGASIWQLSAGVPVALAAVALAIWHSPYRMARLVSFLDPWADPMGSGYHPIQSLLAIAMGGVTGRGLGNGIQKFGYLPEDTTDFIFAIICEELGFAGAALVVMMYLAILWLGMGIVRDCRDAFGRLIAIGVLMTIALQAIINIAVVTVVVPTKGIALPLISAGGTGWILTAAAAGLIVALDTANAMEREEHPHRPLSLAA